MSEKRNQRKVVDNRWEKKADKGRQVDPKFEEERTAKVLPLMAKNEAQREALKAFVDKQLIILSGSAGTGKSNLCVGGQASFGLRGLLITL